MDRPGEFDGEAGPDESGFEVLPTDRRAGRAAWLVLALTLLLILAVLIWAGTTFDADAAGGCGG